MIGRGIFGTINSASLRFFTEKLAVSPSSTVDEGQHDTIYVTLELLLHVEPVAQKKWAACLNQLVQHKYTNLCHNVTTSPTLLTPLGLDNILIIVFVY